ncbi:unnamed protein product [Caenorhabditis auriculariae]|uniref:CUB domain-containing protein n=1 Tax=Caenorhabditis auriculariae TaxID=2777116 RepID=A0A8S1H3E3_9PELO|nr:unnamed protein product [Caenorhabditis auriculariae]
MSSPGRLSRPIRSASSSLDYQMMMMMMMMRTGLSDDAAAAAWAIFWVAQAMTSFDDVITQCRCVVFNVSSGLFHSPEYPGALENVDCLFYHFQAPRNHFIRLTFDVFHLPPRIGTCSSSVMLYDHSNDGLVDIDQKADFEFCGKEIVVGRQFVSKDEHMILQIRHKRESSRGFSGTFQSIPKANFTTEAVEISECSYRVEKNMALIYSPNYPYFYPSRVNCTYIVPQRKGFQIIAMTKFLELGKDASLQIFESTEGERLRHIDGFINVPFFSAGVNDFERAVGFVIELQYASAVWLHTDDSSFPSSSSSSAFAGAATECLLQVTSENFKEGSLSSEKIGKFASSMPTKCRVVFQGYPNEKISLKFTHFNLYVPDNKNISKRCTDVDNVSADVRVGARLSRIEEWCGDRTPPNLMSSTNLIQIEYATKSSRLVRESSKDDIGFRLDYKFHTDWNMEQMRAKADRTKECRFLFNSTEHTNGKIVVRQLSWFISEEHILRIYFSTGALIKLYTFISNISMSRVFNQCDETTQSDYIIFSNYQTHDRTNRRFCGKIAPRGPILSESNYFRMIFFTNDIFDATGFYAHYQFITQEKPQISRVKLTTSASFRHFDVFFSFNFSLLTSFLPYSLVVPFSVSFDFFSRGSARRLENRPVGRPRHTIIIPPLRRRLEMSQAAVLDKISTLLQQKALEQGPSSPVQAEIHGSRRAASPIPAVVKKAKNEEDLLSDSDSFDDTVQGDCIIPHLTFSVGTVLRSDEVFCTVPGRLSFLSSTTKYKVTLGEIQRRLGPPENLNASMLGGILRRAKAKNGGRELRETLERLGLSLPAGRRKSATVTLLTSMVEGEAEHLARDFASICTNEFPIRAVAVHAAGQYKSAEKRQKRKEELRTALGVLEDLINILTPPIVDSPLKEPLDMFNLITHNFGTTVLQAAYSTAKKLIEAQIVTLAEPVAEPKMPKPTAAMFNNIQGADLAALAAMLFANNQAAANGVNKFN